LHIALQMILLTVYLRHTRGLARVTLCAWFMLIAASTLLTWQHHIIDVLGGVALGALCIHLFQDLPLCQPVVRHLRVGIYYLAGAVTLLASAIVLKSWGLLLLWP